MKKTLPNELQADIKTLRFMAITMVVCGLITIIGIPWAVLYVFVAIKPANKNLLKFAAVATIPICVFLVPIFLELGLWRMFKKLNAYQSQSVKAFVSNSEWKKLRFWRKYNLAIEMVIVMIILLVMAFPVPRTISTVVDIPYQTQRIQDSSLELGTSETRQPGANGQGEERRREVKPLLAFVFGLKVQYSKTLLPTLTTQAPTSQIVAQGTKKYQYMWCSDGSYRYYTNTQFQSPGVGFTHRSPDYCAQNNDGHMTGLADTAPPQQTTRTVYEPNYITSPTYTTCNEGFSGSFNCTTY